MVLKSYFERILAEYQIARVHQEFRSHPLGALLRKEIPDHLRSITSDPDRYRIIGTQGKGRWTDSPWIAILDKSLTTTPEQGFYPVYLFREDMSGIYLSLNQGTEKLWKEHGKKGATLLLNSNAADMRREIDKGPLRFKEKNIDLRCSNKSSRSSRYEIGNVMAAFYDADSIPQDIELQSDLEEILSIYDRLLSDTVVGRRVGAATTFRPEEDEVGLTEEDATRLREHKIYDRQPGLSAKVKKIHGYKCTACGFDFKECYGDIGSGYIEAHHLIPFAEITGKRRKVDLQTDFTVLCANCHRMIHRPGAPDDIDSLKAIVRSSNKGRTP